MSELSPASRSTSDTHAFADLHRYSVLLSAVAGYVDAAGFASLFGLFPAHITGELVAGAIALSSGHVAAHTHLWAFPLFVGAVVLATLVARILRHCGLPARSGLLALVTLALASFAVSDLVAWLFHAGPLPVVVRGGFAIAAMGFQSALMRESLAGSCPTTVMTGNLTQVVIELVDRVMSKLTRTSMIEDVRQPPRAPVARVLLVFMLSAALGGFLTRNYGSLSVTLPTLITAVLMVQAFREDAARSAPAPSFEQDALWLDLFTPSTRVGCATDALSCDPLLDGLHTEMSSATRIKAQPPLTQPQTEPPHRISGIQRRKR